MDYELELNTVQKWLKATSGLNSWRRAAAPPTLPRPVIIWESPYRGRKRNLHKYAYTQSVKYYGKLFINSVDEVLRLQNLLTEDLENRLGRLEVLDKGILVGYIKAAEIVFNQTEGLDVPFTFSYEVSYSRSRKEPLPPPTYVHTKVTSNFMQASENQKL